MTKRHYFESDPSDPEFNRDQDNRLFAALTRDVARNNALEQVRAPKPQPKRRPRKTR